MGSSCRHPPKCRAPPWDQGPAYDLPAQLREGSAHRPSPRKNSSNNRGILVFHVRLEGQPYHRSEGRPAASELKVAKSAFPEGQPLPRLLVKEPRVAAPESCRTVHQEKRGPDRAMELILGEVQSNARGGKFLPPIGNPVRRSTESAAVMWSPRPTRTPQGTESTSALRPLKRLQRSWQTGRRRRRRWRFQSCWKTSAQGVKFVKLKATLANVRFWDSEGKRTEAPDSLRGRRILAAAQPRQLWVMNQQRGLLLELRDVKLDEGVEECPFYGKGSRCGLRARLPEAQQGPAGQPQRRAFNFEPIAPHALQNSFFVTSENFDAFIAEVNERSLFFWLVGALNLPASNEKQ